jgi:mRNA interferase RelE/StbE
MSRIVVHRRAAKYLKNLPQEHQERVKSVLKRLAAAPLSYPGVIQMAGDWSGYFRIRVGQIRIIFWFDEEEDIVYVDHIGSRGDVYKQ